MLHYLASPYTSDTPEIMKARYEMALTACALLLKMNLPAYSPIVHWHVVSEVYFDIPYSMYLENDLVHLTKCDKLIVLTAIGWDKSFGVAAEIEKAQDLNMPIQYFSPTTGELTDVPTTN